MTSAADVVLNFLALTWLGAIPALMNGSMPAEIAVEYIRRLRAAGVIIDADHAGLAAHRPRRADHRRRGRDRHRRSGPARPRTTGTTPTIRWPSRTRPGTTRMPAAVVHSHQSLFAAVRAVRLTEPRQHGPVREMSAFPQAHTAGIIILNEALCNGYELLCLSEQGGAFARSGEVIIDAIERWRPTAVYGFAVTWAELARYDLTARDVSSVRFWSNSGDCAHEAHIRRLVAVGSHHAYSKDGIVSLPGSRFNDTLGSTEMGYGGFGISHHPGSERYNRCVGKPQPFAEIILVDPRTGEEVPAGQVGMVAMKSPTLAIGYWNDSVNTFRTRLNGYYLTGDLMYRDEDGYFYHVDRASDAVDLGDGNWLYTALSEERILKRCPDVRDCTVLAARGDDGRLVTEVLLAARGGRRSRAGPRRRGPCRARRGSGGGAAADRDHPRRRDRRGADRQGPQVPHARAAAGQRGRVRRRRERLMPGAQDSLPYAVVVNDEEQYSIWQAGRDLPAGWRPDGFTGTEDECLAYIDETWTDMRPASLRRWMRDHEQAGAD